MPSPSGPTRRDLLLGAAVAGAALAACNSGAGRARSPNERLRIAVIGCGGKGLSDMQACAKGHDIIALCDVDEVSARNAREAQPKAAFYHDYRDLFDQEKPDAVVVATPDHSHAIPALIAMQLGYHVFVQKPLTHTVEEARLLLATARRQGVVTSMGNQGTCLDGFRQAAEVVRSGAIGKVEQVHVWTNRPIWPQGTDRPKHIDPIPATLRWDLWLGPARWRPYAAGRNGFDGYAPFHWRGFWDFGTGAIGDMACHTANLPFFALELSAPEWVEAESSGSNAETAPKQSTIRFQFPARADRGPVLLTWYDGGRLPPTELLASVDHRPEQAGGFLLVGSQGKLYSPTDYGERYELFPRAKFAGYQPPKPSLPRSPGVHEEWLQCILDRKRPLASFEYAAPLTEAMLLGNVALRTGQRIDWDAAAMRARNCPAAEQYLRRQYRREFRLPV